MQILDGKTARDFYTEKLREKISRHGMPISLAIIQVGKNEESSAYIRQKKKFGLSLGIEVKHILLPDNISFVDLEKEISTLNSDKKVNGIIVQLPLPPHLEKLSVINLITPEKDVDGLTETSRKKMMHGDITGFVPATARGISSLLDFYHISVAGKKVAMLGRSMLVGEPTARLLKASGASVTVCHSETLHTRDITKASDIIIVAIGKPELIDDTYVGTNMPTVIDVGINTIAGEKLEEEIGGRKIVGDVAFEKVKDKVAAISPVPGGVGPMTVLCLFENVVEAAKRSTMKT
ncbi:MAG TPA: bifunctional 5,10-methylenetetrahydrofolate dehydrogenase/5,10-methenyltetrahydrofolate cyclohydrolase [Candidatus Paceibacterota bacterium]|nr:bifunctional 5,10-methylenetetrahydrofolate dehydrogenase/5,10-methenyltetrahydrofolate cyclohydrolase [Candidatus Paceibacterota bacterium]